MGTPLTTIPSGVFNLTTIEVYDDNNLDSLPHHGFHRWTALRIFAVYLGRLTQFPPEPFRVCNRLTYVEISSSPLLQLTTDLFVGATALESVLLIGNSIMPEIPAGLFTPVAHSLQTLAIRCGLPPPSLCCFLSRALWFFQYALFVSFSPPLLPCRVPMLFCKGRVVLPRCPRRLGPSVRVCALFATEHLAFGPSSKSDCLW